MTGKTIRASKGLMVLSMGLFALLAGVGNVLDPGANLPFVQHILSMDTIFPDSPMAWRAITSPVLHQLVFWCIIAVEFLIAALCLWGGTRLLLAVGVPAARFNAAKAPTIAGLTLGVLLWFTGFIAIGGEWFLMWQSEQWNGIGASFRFSTSMFLTLLFVVSEDRD